MDFHQTYYSIKSKLERLKNNINIRTHVCYVHSCSLM